MPHVAQGSFGIVYRGTVKDRKEEVAIKDIKVTSYQLFEEWKKEVEFMGYRLFFFSSPLLQVGHARSHFLSGSTKINTL